MFRIFYAEKDTTVYEKYPTQNTGIDQILELTKIASGSRLNGIIQTNQYNSRILLDFGTQITAISQSIVDRTMPDLGVLTPMSASCYLTLKAADASDLLHDYELRAYAVSESWSNGNGNYSDVPITKDGASWYYRTSDAASDEWGKTGHNADTMLGTTEESKGGVSWVTASSGEFLEASQSFSNESPDVRMDITHLVSMWIKNPASYPNYGLILKHTYANETNSKIVGSIKYFGRESHTIFVPRLEVQWNENTASGAYAEYEALVSQVYGDSFVVYMKNIKHEYKRSEIPKFRVGARPMFPVKEYKNESFFMTNHRLPTSSYFSILDSVTNETIVPFHKDATRIIGDASGSYFRLRMDSFMPERFYKIVIKTEIGKSNNWPDADRYGGADVQVFDDFYFKVVN